MKDIFKKIIEGFKNDGGIYQQRGYHISPVNPYNNKRPEFCKVNKTVPIYDYEDIRNNIADNIKLYRKNNLLSQNELAVNLGWSRGKLTNIENARTHLYFKDVIHLSKVLRISINDLMR